MDNLDFENNSGLAGVKLDDSDGVASDKLVRAYELYEAKRYNDAIAIASGESQIISSSYGQVLLGNCYKALNNKESAMQHWKKAIEISPLEYAAYINIANEHYAAGNISEAILNWTIASTIVPENSVVNLNLAAAYDKKGFRIKSTKYFEKYLLYEPNTTSREYLQVKHTITNLTAKVDFFTKRLAEYKAKRDIKVIAALYLKMIATYANLPNIYANIAEIFFFDKNYEKALEFFSTVYLNYPHTPKIILDVANLCYVLNKPSYAYCYYSKALNYLSEGTSFYVKASEKIRALYSLVREPDIIEAHLQAAKEAEADNDYERAIDEYENYIILTDSESPEIQQVIDKYKIFINPEPFVVNVLYSQIPDLMNRKKLKACVDVCDRILKLADSHTKEAVYAVKCRTDCKRILLAREQFGV